jgi:hypothetical protein
MKKAIVFFIIALFFFSCPISAQEDKAEFLRASLERLKSISTGKDRSSQQEVDYDYGLLFYYGVADSYWWTGLVIYNISHVPNYIMVGYFDENGDAVGVGTFILEGTALRAGLLDGFLSTGYVPYRSSIGIFGTELFGAEKFVGNESGGFGEINMEAIYLE